jgi:DnaJ domain
MCSGRRPIAWPPRARPIGTPPEVTLGATSAGAHHLRVQTNRQPDAYRVLNVRPDAHQAVVRAAFHALAALYHPDVNPSPDADSRMAELNRAYALIRTPDLRAVYETRSLTPEAPKAAWAMGGATPPPPSARPGTEDSLVIEFGRYAGWRLADLVIHDPDYLRWLSRHVSGVRYRGEIERLLADVAPKAAPAAAKRRSRWSALGI